MKKVLLALGFVFGIALSGQSHAALAERYKCECFDTGAECDGLDYLTVIVDGNRIQAQSLDRDRDPTGVFQAKLDKTYKPRKYKDYDRFLVTSDENKNYPYFLVHHEISRDGWSKGNIKLIEKSKNGYAWTWEFECKFDRYVAPLPVIKGGASD